MHLYAKVIFIPCATLRESPNNNSPIVTTEYTGSILEVDGPSIDGYTKVTNVMGVEGWVLEQDLEYLDY